MCKIMAIPQPVFMSFSNLGEYRIKVNPWVTHPRLRLMGDSGGQILAEVTGLKIRRID